MGTINTLLTFVNVLFPKFSILALNHKDSAMGFQIVFIVVWLGSIIVTVNGQLLGGSMYEIGRAHV